MSLFTGINVFTFIGQALGGMGLDGFSRTTLGAFL